MSFLFNWTFFDKDALYARAKSAMKDAMSRTKKPPIIVGDMDVEAFEFGTVPPRLEILDIGDIGIDKFRGIFKLHYEGDASLTLRTRIEANALSMLYRKQRTSFAMPQILAASQSLELPLQLKISRIVLSGIVVIVYSRARGLTVVFQNDPVDSVEVESTFDFVYGVKDFISKEIQARLTESLRDDIPAALFELSQAQSGQGAQQTDVHNEDSECLDASVISVPSNQPVVGLKELAGFYSTLNPLVPRMLDAESRATLHQYDRPSTLPHDLDSISDRKALLSEILKDDVHSAERRQVKPKRRVINLRKKSSGESQRSGSETPISLIADGDSTMGSTTAANSTAASPDFDVTVSQPTFEALDGAYFTSNRQSPSKSPSPPVMRLDTSSTPRGATPVEKKYVLRSSTPALTDVPPSYLA